MKSYVRLSRAYKNLQKNEERIEVITQTVKIESLDQ